MSRPTKSQRLLAIVALFLGFFVAEISIGFRTRSLALVADAFHCLNDIMGFIVAMIAVNVSKREHVPKELSFGWQRAQLLGAFFNGVSLLAFGVSIFLQSIERFMSVPTVENPMLVMIMGCVGLALNIISVLFLHDHHHHHDDTHIPEDFSLRGLNSTSSIKKDEHFHKDHRHFTASAITSQHLHQHQHQHDLGMMGVIVHLMGDAINNVGVIVAAIVIWKSEFPGRFYADPAVSMGISFMILATAIPLCKKVGSILMESVPHGVRLEDVKHDLELIPGVFKVVELHAWRLSQEVALASAHVLTTNESLEEFTWTAKMINECLQAYGISKSTLEPKLVRRPKPNATKEREQRKLDT
ncbi:hypothetical protein K3495_g2846 [Podosphaera aphanis]|nr:hypothetical protein K3495_g2846 [Podosphaera aphanis]